MALLPEAAVKALVLTEFGTAGSVRINNRIYKLTDVFLEIARLESGFRTDAIGAAGEVGLWQIHPVNFAHYGVNKLSLMVPTVNASVAHKIYDDAGLNAWTTATRAIANLSGTSDDNPNALTPAELAQVKAIIERVDREKNLRLYKSGQTWETLPDSDKLKAARLIASRYSGSLSEAERKLLERYSAGTEPSAADVLKDSVDVIASPISGIADAIVSVVRILIDPTFWKRFGLGVLGFLVIVGAFIFWNRDTITGIAGKVPK